jgi:hypothetical protein
VHVVVWEASKPEIAASYLDRAIKLAQELGYL